MNSELDLISIELYQDPGGDMLVKPSNGKLFLLDERKREFIVPMKSLIKNDYQKAWQGCCEWNHKSKPNAIKFDFLNVRRFCKCNFQKYDGRLDIDENGTLHFEFTDCPLRGECKYEGVICSPEFSNSLTENDKSILKMIVYKQMTADQIALNLDRSINTINNRRKTILEKTGCKTISQLVAYCYEHNLR
ncbi:helix-turn-helix transcriptional regulator [uncultured Bacteroides sp.]|uniref:helix-turn-helix domain-containing protein n=1 Tax=uncultured Bacteroides sp. TaxID=162156 RepID=UPI002AAAC1D8|nr:helix-turn-helix transcriptional regulator [uncultured Bacteroides sp.]